MAARKLGERRAGNNSRGQFFPRFISLVTWWTITEWGTVCSLSQNKPWDATDSLSLLLWLQEWRQEQPRSSEELYILVRWDRSPNRTETRDLSLVLTKENTYSLQFPRQSVRKSSFLCDISNTRDSVSSDFQTQRGELRCLEMRWNTISSRVFDIFS